MTTFWPKSTCKICSYVLSQISFHDTTFSVVFILTNEWTNPDLINLQNFPIPFSNISTLANNIPVTITSVTLIIYVTPTSTLLLDKDGWLIDERKSEEKLVRFPLKKRKDQEKKEQTTALHNPLIPDAGFTLHGRRLFEMIRSTAAAPAHCLDVVVVSEAPPASVSTRCIAWSTLKQENPPPVRRTPSDDRFPDRSPSLDGTPVLHHDRTRNQGFRSHFSSRVPIGSPACWRTSSFRTDCKAPREVRFRSHSNERQRERKGKNVLPSAEEKAAKGCQEEPGLQAWMNEVQGLQILLHVHRNRIVDGPESWNPGEILAPFHIGMHVEHGEPFFP